MDTRIVTGMRTAPYNLSIFPKEDNIPVTKQNENMVQKGSEEIKIDETDKGIIERLAANGRIPFSKIAKDLSVSTNHIVKRYEMLKNNGVIVPTIQIDPTKIGYYSFAFISLAFSSTNLHSGLEFLKKYPDFNAIYKTSGKFDAVAIFMIRDLEHLMNMQEEIMNLLGVTNVEIEVTRLFNVWPPSRETFLRHNELDLE